MQMGNMNITVSANVTTGLIDGNITWSNSWTNPDEVDALELGHRFTIHNTLSAKLYKAQKLGAQYACERPRLNGNNRDST